MTQLKFVHVGMGHLVNANRVLAVIKPSSACGRRYSRNAKEMDKYIDATVGRTLKSLLILDDSSVMASCIRAQTLLRRFSGEDIASESEDASEPDEEDKSEIEEGTEGDETL